MEEGDTAGIEPGESSAALISAEPVQMAAAEAPTLTDNDLVARTFEALDVELTTAPGELTRRTVRTVTINPDGSVAGTESLVAEAAAPVDEASAEPAAVEVAAPDPAANAAPLSPEGRGEAEAASSESSEAVMAYAPVKGDAAEVTGKGANVRSLPQRGGSEVLFALPGGAAVTIVEMRQGWARVVDERGRSGWIYGEYLRRG